MARKAYRSPLLGYLLIIAGGATLLSILVVDWRPGNQPSKMGLPLIYGSMFFSPVLIMLGASLIRRDATGLLADRSTRPIVYLRPFAQEKVSSPGNLRWDAFVRGLHLTPVKIAIGIIIAIGVNMIVGGGLQMAGKGFERAVQVWGLSFTSGVFLVMLYGAFYAYRMMRGRVGVTLEQELCHHLRGYGPVVAVGHPGEWFSPEGGARVYLDDDSWQATVLDVIRRSRLIVLHLVPEGWTWWEAGHALRSDDPTRVLGVVAGSLLSEECYELLREQMRREFGVSLGEIKPDFALYRFDADLTPHLLTLRWIPGVFWPFTPYRLSRSTLEPYLSGCERIDSGVA